MVVYMNPIRLEVAAVLESKFGFGSQGRTLRSLTRSSLRIVTIRHREGFFEAGLMFGEWGGITATVPA